MSDLVPEDFDLDKARRAESTTPSEERKRCPNCGCTDIHSKVDKPYGQRKNDQPHYCNICGHHFDEPVYGDPTDA